MMRLTPLLLLTACTSWMHSPVPDGTTAPSETERAAIEDVIARWQAHPELPEISDRCIAYARSVEILEVDAEGLGRWCNQTVGVLDDGGCPAIFEGGSAPVIVVYEGVTGRNRDWHVHHESVHVIGHCFAITIDDRGPKVPHWPHTDPRLWGWGGVHEPR